MRRRTIGVVLVGLTTGVVGLLLISAGATAGEMERGAPSRLAVNLEGTGEGKVVSSPSGINCPDQCIYPVESGKQYTLTASASEGSEFVSWGGACDSTTATTCTFVVQQGTNLYEPVFNKVTSGGDNACAKAKAKLAKAKAKLAKLKADDAPDSKIDKAKKKVKKAKKKVKKAC